MSNPQPHDDTPGKIRDHYPIKFIESALMKYGPEGLSREAVRDALRKGWEDSEIPND